MHLMSFFIFETYFFVMVDMSLIEHVPGSTS